MSERRRRRGKSAPGSKVKRRIYKAQLKTAKRVEKDWFNAFLVDHPYPSSSGPIHWLTPLPHFK